VDLQDLAVSVVPTQPVGSLNKSISDICLHRPAFLLRL
jgi:hypothetical protein